ncbi:hypothetical protein [Sphingomonas sp. GB1N7]|uniref:hypothetical protein n=1 Tax=Parasphingomonas caseinilytica TaxID=3096158 RepID=UPI002FC854C8
MDVALIFPIVLLAMSPTASFQCAVIRVHDGDGPLWCKNGIKVRVARIQAPDFEDAEPCRQHRAAYRCDDAAAARSQHIVERMTLAARPSVSRSAKATLAS